MIADAASSGDRLKTLKAMRDKLARDMDEAPPAVVAQIAGRLQAILTDIDSIAKPGKASTFDELAKRRADRIADPPAGAPASGQVRQRRT